MQLFPDLQLMIAVGEWGDAEWKLIVGFSGGCQDEIEG